jgi:hypothetical protein
MAEEDLSRPAFRYPSSGRRPERLNQSRDVNTPLQLLRGWAAGTLGLPGDIEGLVRMLPGIKDETPVLPTSDFYREWLPGYDERPAARAMSGLGALTGGMGATRVARAGLGAVKRATDVNAIRDYVRAAQGVSGMPGTAVIKPKGGNWLAGAQSPEASVQRLKRSVEGEVVTPEMAKEHWDVASVDLFPDAALNRWIDKKLAGYIRNEMATPEDPIRALAERGRLHVDPEQLNFRPEMYGKYPQPGQQFLAKSPAAKQWEAVSDEALASGRASDFIGNENFPGNPWLEKIPPETPVHWIPGGEASGIREDLGFQHLVDELRNAVNPESGLPRELLWKYSDLDKVTVPQAVQRVADINQWRAAQKAEADAARAMNPATQVFKEYPEQGYRLVELKMPKDLPEGWTKRGRTLVGPNGERALEGSVNDPRYKILEDALKYEGEVMGHCVGGYCPYVVEGRSRIFSLRDTKGQPHVTVEVKPDTTPPRHDRIIDEIKRVVGSNNIPDDDAYDALYKKAMASVMANRPQDIIQIKGKGNKAPKEEYLPFVQDFVRSGQWGRVGDIQNTGMRPMREVFNNAELEMLKKAGAELPEHGYLTGDQIQQLHNMVVPEGQRLKYDWRGNVVGDERQQNFAQGGAVTAPPGPAQYDPARIDALAAELLAA